MKKIKVTKKTINGEIKLFVNPNDLIPNKNNKKIYSNKEEELKKQEEIAETYKVRVSKGKPANKQPVIIWRDGLTEAGHTRIDAAKLSGCDVWVTFSDEDYPNPDKPLIADHKNKDRRDYRLENLRWATSSENNTNVDRSGTGFFEDRITRYTHTHKK